MFRKRVVVCALGSALLGATFPEGPLLAAQKTCKAPVKKPCTHATPSPSVAKAQVPREGRWRLEARHARRRPQPAATRTVHRVFVLEKSRAAPIAPIGAFAVTAYTHYRNRRGGVNKTATGTLPRAGRTVAVDPRVIPFGTRIHISGVGERIAEDTGRNIKGRRLDLFLPSKRECQRFGVRRHEVYLVAR
jgi:3D (Asp-Asp-Asp) domain-containing protein